jgi:hypothetical protein
MIEYLTSKFIILYSIFDIKIFFNASRTLIRYQVEVTCTVATAVLALRVRCQK